MAINKVQKADGTVLIDLTNDTVSANSLLQGSTAHNRSGTQIQGEVVVAPIDDTTTASNKVWSSQKVNSVTGELSNLHTTDKTSLVNAINEVKENSITPHLIISSESGSTVTVSNGTITLTPTETGSTGIWECNVPKFDTWTITSTRIGKTATTTVDIDVAKIYEVSVYYVPEGSTVLPTDDIQTWLECGGIFDKAYTTLGEVLADTTTLSALINDNNASDYLVRSTTWATSVCADSTAMTYIGANDYCANTLLSDNTWLSAICNSTYFESVLNVKVPTMTSNTTPSGEVSASSSLSPNEPWYAFRGTIADDVGWMGQPSQSSYWLKYEFNNPIACNKLEIVNKEANRRIISFDLVASNDNSNWTRLGTFTMPSTMDLSIKTFTFNNNTMYKYYMLNNFVCEKSFGPIVNYLQFYGRASS